MATFLGHPPQARTTGLKLKVYNDQSNAAEVNFLSAKTPHAKKIKSFESEGYFVSDPDVFQFIQFKQPDSDYYPILRLKLSPDHGDTVLSAKFSDLIHVTSKAEEEGRLPCGKMSYKNMGRVHVPGSMPEDDKRSRAWEIGCGISGSTPTRQAPPGTPPPPLNLKGAAEAH